MQVRLKAPSRAKSAFVQEAELATQQHFPSGQKGRKFVLLVDK
jgi:hypothetical protein